MANKRNYKFSIIEKVSVSRYCSKHAEKTAVRERGTRHCQKTVLVPHSEDVLECAVKACVRRRLVVGHLRLHSEICHNAPMRCIPEPNGPATTD